MQVYHYYNRRVCKWKGTATLLDFNSGDVIFISCAFYNLYTSPDFVCVIHQTKQLSVYHYDSRKVLFMTFAIPFTQSVLRYNTHYFGGWTPSCPFLIHWSTVACCRCCFVFCAVTTSLSVWSALYLKEKKEEIWISPMHEVPIPTKIAKSKVIKEKCLISQRLRTDLGRSFGVIATI